MPDVAAPVHVSDVTADAVNGRRTRVTAEVAAMLITDPDNILWLTGDWEPTPPRWLLYAGGE